MIFTNQTPREELLALIIQHERLDTRLYQLKTKKLRLGSRFSAEDEIELVGLNAVTRSIKKDYQFAMKKIHDGIHI